MIMTKVLHSFHFSSTGFCAVRFLHPFLNVLLDVAFLAYVLVSRFMKFVLIHLPYIQGITWTDANALANWPLHIKN